MVETTREVPRIAITVIIAITVTTIRTIIVPAIVTVMESCIAESHPVVIALPLVMIVLLAVTVLLLAVIILLLAVTVRLLMIIRTPVNGHLPITAPLLANGTHRVVPNQRIERTLIPLFVTNKDSIDCG